MSLKKDKNRALGQKVVRALKNRFMDAYFVETIEEANKLALSLMPEGSSVGWGGTMTVDEGGLKDLLRERNYKIIDRDTAATPEERNQLMIDCLSTDFFLGSSNAISENGVLFNIDGMGNRLAAMCFGPKNVILICGMNKVCKDEDTALKRARNEAAVTNALRFPGDRPCTEAGTCLNCLKPDTICCQLLVTRMSKIPGRTKVILVNEDLGL
ncbi:MAG: lactate utilization protein [Lachnospiraceae bacterium]|nr:lactate utilization protein [Lachnospiraceae bacterium]